MVYTYCAPNNTIRETFTFTFSTGRPLKFCFEQPLIAPLTLKRRRALSDVDGAGNEGRKKRRLRLHLITSRLSRPFSQPASNIVNRGSSKIAAWGKNRAPSKNLLRKAAIMNAWRLKMDSVKAVMKEQQRKERAGGLRELMVQKPRWNEVPLPPSPLGLSNYDAFDLEDEMNDEDCEGGLERCSAIYSDFNIMAPEGREEDAFDYLDALDGISTENLPDTPPAPPQEDGIIEILREKERLDDSLFVRV